MLRPVFDFEVLQRAIVALLAALTLTACAGSDVVGDKSRRFDQATAAFDAGDHPTAYAIWSQLADENDLAAMRNTAHMLRRGLGIQQNYGRALDLYTEAARKGLVLAMANVAEMHMNGEGTLKDPEEAARWYALAANGGLSIAMVRLAEMLEQGNGVPKDISRAQELRARAAKNGFGLAQDQSASRPAPAPATSASTQASTIPASSPGPQRAMRPVADEQDLKSRPQVTGAQSPRPAPGALPALDPSSLNGIAQQDAQRLQAGWVAYQAGQMKDAFRLWRGLADKGVAEAQMRIGGMFEHGLGVNQDMIESYRWYKLAAASNNLQAAAGADRVARRMSPAEKAIAESMAASPQHWQARDR